MATGINFKIQLFEQNFAQLQGTFIEGWPLETINDYLKNVKWHTYLTFPNTYQYCNKQLPMNIFKVDKAFRNEINARQNVIRGREFTQ